MMRPVLSHVNRVTSLPTLQRIPPERSLDVIVRYSPTEAGEAETQLLIRSDDESAGDEGLVAVDLCELLGPTRFEHRTLRT